MAEKRKIPCIGGPLDGGAQPEEQTPGIAVYFGGQKERLALYIREGEVYRFQRTCTEEELNKITGKLP